MTHKHNHLSRWEKVFYLTILVLALFSRFYILGDRAISHDESIHTKFSWNLYHGDGFQHNPMMHGPFLFEVTALVYFLFGVSDFTARAFVALVGVALVMTPLLFRRWLGKYGAAAAALMLLLSPSITYYSRYIRHDAPVMLAAVLFLWTCLRYLEEGKSRWLYGLAATFALMYAIKEVAYIYTAIFGLLLFLPFAWQVVRTRWARPERFYLFLGAMLLVLVMGAVFVFSFRGAQIEEMSLDEAGNTRVANVSIPAWGAIAAGIAFVTLIAAVIIIYHGVGEEQMAQIRLFDLLMVIGTLTLPLGSAFLIKFIARVDMGLFYDALMNGSFGILPASTILSAALMLIATVMGAIFLGLWWDASRWPTIGIIHYAIFFVTYTTFFTNGLGILSGLVGSLAYWMAQQGVERGTQPWYYYLFIGPIYEYLPILFSVGSGVAALGHILIPRVEPVSSSTSAKHKKPPAVPPPDTHRLFPLILAGWTALSWMAYSYAGEKMPWLLVHIALPSIFLSAWGLGGLIARWARARASWTWEAVLWVALPLLLAASVLLVRGMAAYRAATADGIPEAGPTLDQLDALGQLIGAFLGILFFGGLGVKSILELGIGRALLSALVESAVALALLTLRTSVMLNFINYDLATEFLVYAHGTPDIKIALRQIEEISWRVTGSPHDVKVAYGEDGSWPFTWYMVHYPNAYFYSTSPDETTLLDCPVVIAGTPQYGVVEEILGDDYIHFDYNYLWWPIEDYKGMSWERIRRAWTDKSLRSALWDIFWKRDYTAYARWKDPERPFTLHEWPFRKEFRLYVRRDLAHQVWSYRLGPTGSVEVRPEPRATEPPDPFTAGLRTLAPAQIATLPGAGVRDLERLPDGTLYVADTTGHRIWHITPRGEVLHLWGEYGSGPGQFNEPWGLAVDAEGYVYVADTWNHRIQKFTADGHFVTAWGWLAQVRAYDPAGQGAFFGPRDIAVGPDGNLYVTDTGNKRVQVFDADGTFLREFGGAGSGAGKMDEPVGLAVDAGGYVYVADTWNHRIQLFDPDGNFVRQWDVPSWDERNPEEKPFLTLDEEGRVYVSDPSHRRVLVFDGEGRFLWSLDGDAALLALTFPEGLAVADGLLYVGDAHTGRVLELPLP